MYIHVVQFKFGFMSYKQRMIYMT